jgi:hypothetical protein
MLDVVGSVVAFNQLESGATGRSASQELARRRDS